MTPDDPRHGQNRGYIAGCREACCRRAHAQNHKNQRTRKYLARVDSLRTDGTGTRRRIQALMALGWSTRELDKMLDRRPSYTYRALMGTGDVYLTTAAMVADLYDRLCMTRPIAATEPQAAIIRRSANIAARNGYLPPLAWDNIDDPDEDPRARSVGEDVEVDEVAVHRVLSGDWSSPTTRAERVEVVRLWVAAGRPLRQLELHTGWKPERYYRISDEPVAS